MVISASGIFTAIILLIVLGVLLWLAYFVLNRLRPAEPFYTVAYVLIMVLGVLGLVAILLSLIGIVGPISIR